MTIHRITFDSNTADIIVLSDGLDFNVEHENSQNIAGSGIISTVNQYGIHKVKINAMFTAANYRKLIAWWSWARQGKVFSFTMDSTKMGNTTLDGAAAAGQKTIPLTNHVENPGFETLDGADDFADWTEVEEGTGAVTDDENDYYAGSHACNLSKSAVDDEAYVYQNITVQALEQFVLGFYTKGNGGVAGQYRVYDVTNGADIIALKSTGNITTSYAHVSESFIIPAGCTTIRLYLVASALGSIGTVRFDAVYLDLVYTVGDYCLIKAVDNDDEFEIVEIASISAGVSITAVDNLMFSYTSGDTFRNWRYWPALISLDKTFNPSKVPGTDYYKHSFEFAEDLS